MSSTYGSSGAHDSTRDSRRETFNDTKTGSDTGNNVHDDVESLRTEIRRLTDQITDMVTARGHAAWTRARSNIEGIVSDATAKGEEAIHTVHDAGDSMIGAIEDSLKKRPYTTLAIAAVIGFVFGASWRR